MCMSSTSCHKSVNECKIHTANKKQRCFLKEAAKEGAKSQMTHRHGCVIVYDGNIIARGHNKHVQCNSTTREFSTHAEVDAIRNASRKCRRLLPHCELYVVRVACEKWNCCLKYSKPCFQCRQFISKSGIKNVFYSSNYNFDQIFTSSCRLKIHEKETGRVGYERCILK